MSFFQGATNVTVEGGTQIAAGAGSTINISQSLDQARGAFRDLSAAAAHTALYDSAARFDAPRCHRNTRAKFLDKLERWMLGDGGKFHDARLIWLHGGAGAGKSAIMQSTIERCVRHAVILGSFFFSRTDPSRNYAEVLIPTLAYQLACAFPEAIPILDKIILRNPLIFKASLHTQAYELLVCPFHYLMEIGILDSTNPHRRFFVVDGLDECSDPQKQSLIIQVVATILCDYHVPISFLLASRPEVVIRSAFQKEKRLHNVFASISLDGDVDADSDIRQFVMDSFLDIVDTHPLRHHIVLPWPNSLSIAKLVWKSSGHFVYAATAMKFIASFDDHPARALEVIQGLEPSRTGSPFGELDALYLHILTTAKYSSQVLRILRHCYLTSFFKTVASVCCVFDISPADVELFLSDVQSLVFLSLDNNSELIITSRHVTLEDFLEDERRATSIYMDVDTYHASLVAQYFRLVDMGPQAVTSLVEGASIRGLELHFISALAIAISNSRDVKLLQALLSDHSPQDIWKFCVDGFAPEATVRVGHVRWTGIRSVFLYLDAIRESIANRDNVLFIQQFKMYIQLLLDNVNQIIYRKPQYCIVPALIFSSSPSGLMLVDHFMRHCGRQFRVGGSYRYHLRYIRENIGGVLGPQLFEAIGSLPQSRLSWSADMAITMRLVLQQLRELCRNFFCLSSNHHRSLRIQRTRPSTQDLLSLLRQLPSPLILPDGTYSACVRQGYSRRHAYRISTRRRQCFLLLKAVILYLRKSDCTSEVAKLARKLLPKIALCFPKLMKRARAEMDAYVLRWDESLDGILEKAQSWSINDVD